MASWQNDQHDHPVRATLPTITEDHHFDVIIGSGYKPKHITPEAFIAQFLSAKG